MMQKLENIIEAIRDGQAVEMDGLSTGERCYVALSAGRYDLLPDGLDPIEAWHRLDWRWQDKVARWRRWPASYAEHARMVESPPSRPRRPSLDGCGRDETQPASATPIG